MDFETGLNTPKISILIASASSIQFLVDKKGNLASLGIFFLRLGNVVRFAAWFLDKMLVFLFG